MAAFRARFATWGPNHGPLLAKSALLLPGKRNFPLEWTNYDAFLFTITQSSDMRRFVPFFRDRAGLSQGEPRGKAETFMTFWIATSLLALLVSGLLILALLRGRRPGVSEEPAATFDLQVYRDQLRDIDRDLARGVIAKEDAERVHTEVSRRILAADARVQQAKAAPDQAKGASRVVAVLLAVLVIAGSFGLYRMLGVPGYGDLGLERRLELAKEARDNRPNQQQAEADMPAEPTLELDGDYKALIEQLREKVAAQPEDLQGQVLLAHHEAQTGNFTAARAAQAKVIDLMGDTAGAKEYGELAELLIVATGGYVSPEAEDALHMALEHEPGNGPARYYWGLMLAQTGRPDLAFRVWESTLRQGPADALWLRPIRAQIGEMAWRAGVDYSPPAAPSGPALGGPSTGDVAAASEMSAEERQEMIRSMVSRLSDRLASEGGSPAEWGRLIGALGVLDETPRAQAIYDEAKTVFANSEDALAALATVAKQAGLSE